ncbi:MAG: hypothetical protein ACP5RD_08390, partial [bacterium]
VVVFHVDYYFISNEYYIFSERDKRFITTAIEFEADKFLEGKSDYFIIRDVIDNYLKYAIFNKDGNQISEWFDEIKEDGLVKGESEYYIAKKKGKYAIYYKDGQKVSDDFSEKHLRDVYRITFNDKLGMVELYSKKLKKLRSIEFQPVPLYREEYLDYTKLLNI